MQMRGRVERRSDAFGQVGRVTESYVGIIERKEPETREQEDEPDGGGENKAEKKLPVTVVYLHICILCKTNASIRLNPGMGPNGRIRSGMGSEYNRVGVSANLLTRLGDIITTCTSQGGTPCGHRHSCAYPGRIDTTASPGYTAAR